MPGASRKQKCLYSSSTDSNDHDQRQTAFGVGLGSPHILSRRPRKLSAPYKLVKAHTLELCSKEQYGQENKDRIYSMHAVPRTRPKERARWWDRTPCLPHKIPSITHGEHNPGARAGHLTWGGPRCQTGRLLWWHLKIRSRSFRTCGNQPQLPFGPEPQWQRPSLVVREPSCCCCLAV